jgi:hypothetical protein
MLPIWLRAWVSSDTTTKLSEELDCVTWVSEAARDLPDVLTTSAFHVPWLAGR